MMLICRPWAGQRCRRREENSEAALPIGADFPVTLRALRQGELEAKP